MAVSILTGGTSSALPQTATWPGAPLWADQRFYLQHIWKHNWLPLSQHKWEKEMKAGPGVKSKPYFESNLLTSKHFTFYFYEKKITFETSKV